MIDEYPFTQEYEGDRVGMDIHTENELHQPAVRWRVESTGASGDRGALRLPIEMEGGHDKGISEPVLSFYDHQPKRTVVGGTDQSTITLSRSVAAAAKAKATRMGTAVTDTERVCTDPNRFPLTISGTTVSDRRKVYEKSGWDDESNLMWYRDTDGELVPYQIERGSLVRRPEAVSRGLREFVSHY